jgi:hypothetical protein
VLLQISCYLPGEPYSPCHHQNYQDQGHQNHRQAAEKATPAHDFVVSRFHTLIVPLEKSGEQAIRLP